MVEAETAASGAVAPGRESEREGEAAAEARAEVMEQPEVAAPACPELAVVEDEMEGELAVRTEASRTEMEGPGQLKVDTVTSSTTAVAARPPPKVKSAGIILSQY